MEVASANLKVRITSTLIMILLTSLLLGSVSAGHVPRIPTIEFLPNLPDCPNYRSIALAINDGGLIVGYTSSIGGTLDVRACLWTAEGDVFELEGLPGTDCTAAVDINNEGKMVGFSGIPRTGPEIREELHAVMWTPEGDLIQLEVLPETTSSRAVYVNDNGEIVGYCQKVDEEGILIWAKACLWTAEGEVIPLQGLSETDSCVAYSINNRGQITGMSEQITGAIQTYPVLWTAEGEVKAIESILNTGQKPYCINNRGQ